jgi:hypothetical protein
LFFFENRLENDAILLNCATNSIRKIVKGSTLQKNISFMSQNYLFFVVYSFFVNLRVNLFMLRILIFSKLLVRQNGLQVLISFHLQLLILSWSTSRSNFFPSNTFQSVKRWSYFLVPNSASAEHTLLSVRMLIDWFGCPVCVMTFCVVNLLTANVESLKCLTLSPNCRILWVSIVTLSKTLA